MKYDPLEFTTLIIKEAGRQKKSSVVYDWTGFTLFYLLAFSPSEESIDELKKHYFTEIRDVFHQFNYDGYEPLYEGLDLNYDVAYITENEWLSEQQKELFIYLKEA